MSHSLKQHNITSTTAIAHRAAADVTQFLQTVWPQTVAVHNVEEEAAYQLHDVDLLWTVLEKERLRVIPVEVKGDRYHRTGNFFFETISNEGKGTPGCFLYTKAEWLFYYFLEIGKLYCLHMEKVRPWFLANMHRFKEQRTSTPTRSGSSYVTIGRLVPITTVLAEVEGVLQFQKEGETWAGLGD
ncbi:MAG: hypothetical protein H6658_01560 [Ardenticatenaceae bacterium]|nr:hypothetical protein [Ardenticatenaceae bacterium]